MRENVFNGDNRIAVIIEMNCSGWRSMDLNVVWPFREGFSVLFMNNRIYLYVWRELKMQRVLTDKFQYIEETEYTSTKFACWM